jgi:hypothetical protein
MAAFIYGFRAPDPRTRYPRRFQYFLNYLRLEGTSEERAKQFVSRARENPIWGGRESYVIYRRSKGKAQKRWDIRIHNYQLLQSNQVLLCNEACLRVANDRAPTIEEIQKLIEYPETKCLALLLKLITNAHN